MTFLGLDFVPLALSQQEELEKFFRRYPQELSAYTFAGLITWSEVYKYSRAYLGETLLLAFSYEKEDRTHLAQPLGEFSPDSQERLLAAMRTLPHPPKIFGVSEAFIADYPDFCSHFDVQPIRGMANYCYRTEALAALEGRRYAAKRNLIHQAQQLYQWSVHELTSDCREPCCRILEGIGKDPNAVVSKNLQEELQALHFMMTHFVRLKQRGCLIKVDGQPIAFSLHEELNPKTAVVHFEKAERRYKGLYQIINQETAKRALRDGYEFMNREEDLDIAGLRKAKLSYQPVALVPFYVLTLRNRI